MGLEIRAFKIRGVTQEVCKEHLLCFNDWRRQWETFWRSSCQCFVCSFWCPLSDTLFSYNHVCTKFLEKLNVSIRICTIVRRPVATQSSAQRYANRISVLLLPLLVISHFYEGKWLELLSTIFHPLPFNLFRIENL